MTKNQRQSQGVDSTMSPEERKANERGKHMLRETRKSSDKLFTANCQLENSGELSRQGSPSKLHQTSREKAERPGLHYRLSIVALRAASTQVDHSCTAGGCDTGRSQLRHTQITAALQAAATQADHSCTASGFDTGRSQLHCRRLRHRQITATL